MTDFKSFFTHLCPIEEDNWRAFEKLFKPMQLKKGEYFIEAGEQARDIAFLEEGIIRAFYRNEKAQEYNKHFFLNPCFIGGYTSLITKQINYINQEALSECRLLVANYAEILQLYEKAPDIERGARILAEQFFVQKEQREVEIVLLDAEERYLKFQKEFPQLEQQIAQYHIASYLGISPTQLSRIRRNLAGK